ncbi:MAG: small ribosomal subunit biogenesis GTPase RsgA [Cyanobacteria bacterium J007]|nr:MAG: small ribosomal subunit biogenesis GTPase RsgA [Cyanobacteria bacterium J007]
MSENRPDPVKEGRSPVQSDRPSLTTKGVTLSRANPSPVSEARGTAAKPHRAREDREPPTDEIEVTGTVVAVQANYYKVQLDEGANATPDTQGETERTTSLLCTRRARLKKIGGQVMVGDRVVVEEPDWAGGRGAISAVFERSSQLDRPPIANASQILLVFAVEEPSLDPHQLTRFAIEAESTGLKTTLCLNKIDLVSPETLERWRDRLQAWGYTVLCASIPRREGLDAIRRQLQGEMTAIAGPSGVGKSSLIDALIPSVNLRVGDVSGKLARGRHTTRHVELFELPDGGLLADTPGFNRPQLDCDPAELVRYFPEARDRLARGQCQFSDCLHRDEPNCVVRGDWERYEDYLQLLEEAIAYRDAKKQQSDPESTLKLKTKRSGRQEYEPKLESKKYRRTSRRVQHQTLQDLYNELGDDPSEEDLEALGLN